MLISPSVAKAHNLIIAKLTWHVPWKQSSEKSGISQ